MKIAFCAITLLAAVAACRGGERASAAATADADTTAAAAGGSISRPAVPEPTPAPAAATEAPRQHAASSTPARKPDPVIARIAGPSAVLRSQRAHTRARADTGAADSAQATKPGGATAGTVKVNQFMSYNKATRTTDVQVFAAYDHSLGGFNFNGGFSGNDTITVPQGWTVNMHVVNKDAIPHSAIIIEGKTPLPAMPDKPALPAAYTTHLTDGLAPQGGSDTMRFKATKAGTYFLACGVPGHAASGMYIVFDVSGTASAPTYKQ